MRRRLTVLVLLSLAGCAAPRPAPEPAPTDPPLLTGWTLQLDVIASPGIRVVGGGISAYEQSIAVDVAAAGEPCSVQAAAPGEGGPDRWVGEKVATSVRGRPALRNGAGAEGPFLIWRAGDSRWITVQCDHEATMAEVADRVRPARTSTLRVPFGLTAPAGYAVSSVDVAQQPLRTTVAISRIDAGDRSLLVTLTPSDASQTPTGERTTVGGRPALRNREPTSPSVCVLAGSAPPAYVCVGIVPSDYGERPDRSADLPVIETIAGSLRFADLDAPSTWFEAEKALR